MHWMNVLDRKESAVNSAKPPLKILFLCTGNSCRSQMAEGWARHLMGASIVAYSAGTSPHGMNPRAIQVMRESGVDISSQSSKHIDSLSNIHFDWVITVCGSANEACPVFPNATHKMHAGFDDPPGLAEGASSEEEALRPYRRVRDEIRDFMKQLPEYLEREK
jgi:arsenate reductase